MTILTAGRFHMHLRESGSGEPVLLLHASSSSGRQWRDLQAALQDRYRVAAPDLLGYGGSSAWDPADELASRDETALLDEAVEHLGGGPVHLVGHSYGGLTALRLAMEGRVRLRSLTLYEPIAFWLLRLAGEAALYGEIRGIADTFRAAFARGDADAAARPYLDYWNGPGAWAAAPEGVRAMLRVTAAKTAREWAPAFEDDTPLAALAAGIAAPTLVLHGGVTNATTRRICGLLAGALPHAVSRAVPGAGHMGPVTHAAAVNAAIVRHIEAWSRGEDHRIQGSRAMPAGLAGGFPVQPRA
ncbi:alpha/beta fold hydrolase [Salinarimonas soli]|uniref:Alpha/beta hydrolase n=1 Tax=Salinarimonas soli TaxID=1638099 RepID=A0A5B2VGC9_9HYPH|nr:alpha/beta fold hydrolase [Salinarimonas soli]KAA2237560.1 alpha/beta hydrolase [Salinarimonas soli]